MAQFPLCLLAKKLVCAPCAPCVPWLEAMFCGREMVDGFKNENMINTWGSEQNWLIWLLVIYCEQYLCYAPIVCPDNMETSFCKALLVFCSFVVVWDQATSCPRSGGP